MNAIQLGPVTISRVVEIGRSSYPTAMMLPESTPAAIAAHLCWLKPDFFDEATGDIGSRIQTYIGLAAQTRRAFVERHADAGVLVLAGHFPRPGYIVRERGGCRFVPAHGRRG